MKFSTFTFVHNMFCSQQTRFTLPTHVLFSCSFQDEVNALHKLCGAVAPAHNLSCLIDSGFAAPVLAVLAASQRVTSCLTIRDTLNVALIEFTRGTILSQDQVDCTARV